MKTVHEVFTSSCKEIRGYCQQIYHNIRELSYNMDLTQIIFVGGGAGVMKRFGGLEQKNISYIEDVRANAKEYEMLGREDKAADSISCCMFQWKFTVE